VCKDIGDSAGLEQVADELETVEMFIDIIKDTI